MHERERWQMILKLVRERGVIEVRDLVASTGASSATIRRDLSKLEETGELRRVHGGVEAVNALGPKDLETRGLAASLVLNIEAKRAIARAAVERVRDGESIIINAGSTTFQMVEWLAARQLNILTNSFAIAQALIAGSDNRIVMPGGEIYRKQGIVVSPFDDDSIQHYTATQMFMSCVSIGPMGVIEGDPLITRAEAKLLRRASKLVVLVDSSKFEPRGSIVVCPLSRVGTVITDDGIPDAAREMLERSGIETIVVPVAGAERMAHSAA